MNTAQSGILAPVPRLARYLEFSLLPDVDSRPSIQRLLELVDGDQIVVGFGRSLTQALGKEIDGLGVFPVHVGQGFDVPSTPSSLWCWMRAEDRGVHVHQTRALTEALAQAFEPDQIIDAFQYGASLDLTGYEDGTENPKDNEAIKAGIVQGRGAGLDGSSFVAVQQWVHDLDHFQSMSQGERDHVMGRRLSDNEEIADAPESAHVKRTAQESFNPEAFILRRSMPWASEDSEGLVFVAFGKSFNAYEAILKRMVGADDGVTDSLFRFTRPVTGSYFWCPPVSGGRLDLSALGL
jgi:putative iron-dependent peroxidase